MENSTPANRSRIPKVNFSASRIKRSTSLATLAISAQQTPLAVERSFSLQNKSVIANMPVSKKEPFRKPLTEGNGVRVKPTSVVKQPINSARDEALARKRPAVTPVSNQSSKAKIPAWDTKALLKQAEENVTTAKGQVAELTTIVSDQEQQLKDLKVKKQALENELRKTKSDLDSLQIKSKDIEEESKTLKDKYAECCSLYEESVLNVEGLRQDLSQKERTCNIMQRGLDELRLAYSEKSTSLAEVTRIATEKDTSLKFYQQECAKLKEQILAQDIKRQILHNKIMELKGNIRVFCRVRPLLATELAQQTTVDHLTFNDENSLEVIKGPKKTKTSFSFDRVFSPTSTQMEIFEELSELVQSVIDGYNVCVFAYGQTGSGKTYTMEGGLGSEERGMIHRSVDHIFAALDTLPALGWKYRAETSFLEIYNETVKDLLNCTPEAKYCDIRNPVTPGGDMMITNLKVETVTTAGEVYSLLNTARRNRAVAATVHNDYSSRSHFVFKLRLVGENENTGKKSDAVLNLVDLAGSEKLVEISENARVAETKNINRSLSNLGNVILALSRKNEHVPYRNSKLTYLLQTSLGGNSKTLMLVNLSPKEDAVEETLNSLRFATRVNECHVGRAQRNLK